MQAMQTSPFPVPATPDAAAQSRARAVRVWTARILSGTVIAFLVFDGVAKLLGIAAVNEAFRQLGYPVGTAPAIGVVVLVCAALYALQRTAVLGAILLTGLLGGAIATHVRVNDPLLSHTLFGVYVGVMAWGGLWLRDARLRALVPLRQPQA